MAHFSIKAVFFRCSDSHYKIRWFLYRLIFYNGNSCTDHSIETNALGQNRLEQLLMAPVLPLYTFLKHYTLFGLFCTLILYSYFFLEEKAWNTFLHFIERILLVFFRMVIPVHTECYCPTRLKNEAILSNYWWDPIAHWHSEWNWNHHQILLQVNYTL